MPGKDEGATERLVGKEEQKRRQTEDEVVGRPKAEWHVGTASDFAEGDRKVFYLGEKEVGVFRKDGRFYGYENLCLHQGGPVCEGLILGKVEPVLEEDQSITGERFSEDEIHIVCPWHG
jgi:nitrite reductase (NADH) small subunit